MIMAATCAPEQCAAMWDRRREASEGRDVRFRQEAIVQEIEERELLKQRCPEWVDDWVRPALLSKAELRMAGKAELAQVDTETLTE
jgi:hypothetical protein